MQFSSQLPTHVFVLPPAHEAIRFSYRLFKQCSLAPSYTSSDTAQRQLFSAASNPTAIFLKKLHSLVFIALYFFSRAHGLTFILNTFIYNKAKCDLLKQGEM